MSGTRVGNERLETSALCDTVLGTLLGNQVVSWLFVTRPRQPKTARHSRYDAIKSAMMDQSAYPRPSIGGMQTGSVLRCCLSCRVTSDRRNITTVTCAATDRLWFLDTTTGSGAIESPMAHRRLADSFTNVAPSSVKCAMRPRSAGRRRKRVDTSNHVHATAAARP